MKVVHRRKYLTHAHSEREKGDQPRSSARSHRLMVIVLVLVVACATAAGYLTHDRWLPQLQPWLAAAGLAASDAPDEHEHTEAEGGNSEHDHEHSADESGYNHAMESLELSEAARRNVGLELATVELTDFNRTITVPAVITERPGRTQIEVSAPMTGIVTRIYPILGEAVSPGQPLFDLRLTHEDLVQAQSQLLQTAEELDVIQREVRRLEEVTASGAIAGKQLLERQYEEQKTEAALRAQKEALMLHGLSQEQVESILNDRQLLRQVTVVCPEPVHDVPRAADEPLLMVSDLETRQGQHVAAGDRLCVVTDHAMLFIQGKAFEQDAPALNEAARLGSPITAVVENTGKGSQTISGLKILYVDNTIEIDSRALRFYVRLPNELVRSDRDAEGHQFIGWRFKPGQRVELLVPVEQWKQRIVLPIDAVVREGPDTFVFRKHGDHFDRRPVHVEFRDQQSAVIGNDGTLFPGDVIVVHGAYQLHLALKNKAAGPADPHAGHNH